MPASTWSSREFNQNTNGAKAAAADGPVIITQRGTPSHVLLTYARYVALMRRGPDMVSLLAMPEEAPYFDFDPPRAAPALEPADLE